MKHEIIFNYDEIALAILNEDRHIPGKWGALLDDVGKQAPKIFQAEAEDRLHHRLSALLSNGGRIAYRMIERGLGGIGLFVGDQMLVVNLGALNLWHLYVALDCHIREGELDAVIGVLEDAFDLPEQVADYICEPENGPCAGDPLPMMEMWVYKEARETASRFAYSMETGMTLMRVPEVRAVIHADGLEGEGLEDFLAEVWVALKAEMGRRSAGMAA